MRWILLYWFVVWSGARSGTKTFSPHATFNTRLQCDITGGQMAVASNGHINWHCVRAMISSDRHRFNYSEHTHGNRK